MTQSAAPRTPNSPSWTLPEGAWDCHAHVFGPEALFPVRHAMHYSPPRAPAAMHTQMLSKVGLAQGVLVQPGLYGDDPSAIIDALQQADGRISGIAVATSDVTDAELDRLHASGVRGLRFNEMTVPGGTERFAGAVGVGALDTLAPRMRDRGWHAEVWARIDQHAALLPRYRASGIPVCLDHMAGLDVSRGVDAPEFQAILSALNEGWLWVKLVLCRCSQDFPKYADLRPYHDALLEANPDRLVWGSDWPHLRLGDKAPDVGDLLDQFRDWVPNEQLRHRILVENPRNLYGC